MLFTIFIKIILYIISTIFLILPAVSLPEGAVNALTSMVQYYNQFLTIFPYAILPTQLFFVIMGIELFMLVGKFILGSRMPVNNNN